MIAVNRKALSLALAALQPAVNKKSFPILQYAHAAVVADTLTLSTTNLDLWIQRAVTVVSEGEPWQPVCLDFAALQEACKAKGELVTLDQSGKGGLMVMSHVGSVEYRIGTMDIDEMPPFPAPAHLDALHVETAIFKDVFGRIAMVASTDDARPVLTAVLLRLEKDNMLTAEAADGFRLARTKMPVLLNGLQDGQTWSALVPAVTAKAIGKLTSSVVTLILEEDTLFVIGENHQERLVIRLIPGTYPDLQQVIPINCKHSLSFLSETMQVALQPLLKAFPPMHFSYEDGQIVLSVTGENEIKSTCSCRLDTEAPPLMAFNPRFLLSLCKVAGTDSLVKMETNIDTTPAMLTIPHADPHFFAVLMPMFLGSD